MSERLPLLSKPKDNSPCSDPAETGSHSSLPTLSPCHHGHNDNTDADSDDHSYDKQSLCKLGRVFRRTLSGRPAIHSRQRSLANPPIPLSVKRARHAAAIAAQAMDPSLTFFQPPLPSVTQTRPLSWTRTRTNFPSDHDDASASLTPKISPGGGYPPTKSRDENTEISSRILSAFELLRSNFFSSFMRILFFIYLVLPCFRPPMWCVQILPDQPIGDHVQCYPIEEQHTFYFFSLWIIPSPSYNVVEILCAFALIATIIFNRYIAGRDYFSNTGRRHSTRLVIIVLQTTLAIYAACQNKMAFHNTAMTTAKDVGHILLKHGFYSLVEYRSVLTAPFVILTFDEFSEVFYDIFILPARLNLQLIGLILFIIYLYASFGIMLYRDRFHNSIVQATYELYVLLTTANYPDVMMLDYNSNRLAFLYYGSFLIIVYFMLLSLVFAVIYTSYRTALLNRERTHVAKRIAGIKVAFDMLDVNKVGYISVNDYMLFLRCIDADLAQFPGLLTKVADTNNDLKISIDEFQDLYKIIRLTVKKTKTSTFRRWLNQYHPNIISLCVKLTKSKQFDLFINFVIATNTIYLFFDVFLRNGQQTITAFIIDIVVTLIFTVEILIKILAQGWFKFTIRFWNRFDLFVVAASYLLYIAYLGHITLGFLSARMALASRALRLIRFTARILKQFRLLSAFKAYRILTTTMAHVFLGCSTVIYFLLLVFYFFSHLGNFFFGGRVYEGASCLVGSMYDSANDPRHYMALNFNDLPAGMVTLFALLVVNNWFEIAEPLIHCSGQPYLIVFFVSFFVIASIFITSVLITLIVETFMVVWRKTQVAEQQAIKHHQSLRKVKRGVLGVAGAQDGGGGDGNVALDSSLDSWSHVTALNNPLFERLQSAMLKNPELTVDFRRTGSLVIGDLFIEELEREGLVSISIPRSSSTTSSGASSSSDLDAESRSKIEDIFSAPP